MQQQDYIRPRQHLVEQFLKPRGICDQAVLNAFERVPRHQFVEPSLRFRAYEDVPLPIGEEQTISQPYVVAAMVQSLKLAADCTVLDIGTGCGYQAAILSCLCKRVYSVERIANLVSKAKHRLERLGFHNVLIKFGDGFLGWQEYAPYDGIIVAAWSSEVSSDLIDQLKVGGRLVMPIGDATSQELVVYHKQATDSVKEFILGKCAFVPLIR